MTDANVRKQLEAGKADWLEPYNVSDAIAEVQRLAKGLIGATKHSKHHFRAEWVRQLVARYRRLPGKAVIHLDDLGDGVIPTISTDIRALLLPSWEKLVQNFGSEWGTNHFRCIRDISVGRRNSSWSSLRVWRNFAALTGFRINALEPYVVALRVSGVGTSRVITNPKLPFNLATPAGAKIFGYRGDTAYQTSAFHNMDSALHEDYKRAITETVGNVPFTTTIRQIDGYQRTNVGTFVTMLTSIAGLNNLKRQKKARNPLPSWFFTSSDEVVISALRSLWDTEGSPTVHSLQLGQAVGLRRIDTKVWIPDWDDRISVNRLEKSVHERICRRPPLLLVSAALLLYRMGIHSYMAPAMTARTKRDYSVYWNLCIYRTRNMRHFEHKIGFLSARQQAQLHGFNLLHTPSSPSPFFSPCKGQR